MSQVAVINRSSLDDTIVAFAVEACRIQIEKHLWKHWLGIIPASIAFYSSEHNLPIAEGTVVVCTIEDAMQPGILGYHTDEFGVQFIRVGANGWNTSVILSHEFLEWFGDPHANGWRRLPSGLLGRASHIAREICDPSQGDTYEIDVEIFRRRERVKVSDFVTPDYFDPRGQRPFSFLDVIDRPFGLSRNGGGYRLLADELSGESWPSVAEGMVEDERARHAVAMKTGNPHTRISRRMAAPLQIQG